MFCGWDGREPVEFPMSNYRVKILLNLSHWGMDMGGGAEFYCCKFACTNTGGKLVLVWVLRV